jgi:hypothetical protein
MGPHLTCRYDYLRVPEHLEPGEYVLGFRWDCETSAQVRDELLELNLSITPFIARGELVELGREPSHFTPRTPHRACRFGNLVQM